MKTLHADVLRHSALLLLRNLPKNITETGVADFLWTKIGINVGEDCLSVSVPETGDTAQCLCAVTRTALADFLNRAVEGQFLGDRRVYIADSKQVKQPADSWTKFASECTPLEKV